MEIDLIQVKGKKQPEAVFAVLGRAEVEQDPRCRELRELNAQHAGALPQAAMGRALALIERCRKLADGFGVAGLYDMYLERIESLPRRSAGPDWDGVYEAESK
jgi:adenylate cyclase